MLNRFGPEQHWGKPSKQDARELMRFVYENYDIARQSCKVSKKWLETYTDSTKISTEWGNICRMYLK